MPFFAALVHTGHATVAYAVFGAFFWLVTSSAIEVTNRLSDRCEDEINRPERTALCDTFGWGRLERAERALWGTLLLVDLAWVAFDGNVALGILLGASLALGFAYSRGPRLARRSALSLLTLSLLFGGAFLIGWAAGDPLSAQGWRLLETGLPFICIIGLFIVAFAGIKDITDTAGDARVDYHSWFVRFVESGGSSSATALALVPFGALIPLVAVGLLPTSLLALLCFAPVSSRLALAVGDAHDAQERMLVREAFYVYWLLLSSASMLLFLPRWEMLVAVVAGGLYWGLTTRFLHWTASPPRGSLLSVLGGSPVRLDTSRRRLGAS